MEGEKKQMGGGCPFHSYCSELYGAVTDRKISEKELKLIEIFQKSIESCASERDRDMHERRKEYLEGFKEQTNSINGIQIKMAKWAGAFVVLSILIQMMCGFLISIAVKVAIESSIPKGDKMINRNTYQIKPPYNEIDPSIAGICKLYP